MRLVRYAELAVLAFSIVLALVELDRIQVLYGGRELIIAAASTAVYLPLHIWHLTYGLRGERPPRSGVTLAAMAVAQLTALALIGPAYSFVLATLATSALVVLRPPWSLALLAGCVVAPIPAALLHPAYITLFQINDAYLMVSVVFRSCLQFTPVWLVVCSRELVASRAVMARRAAEQEHERLEATMRSLLERNLVKLTREAERARSEILEPGVSAALVALDRVLATATNATKELRHAISQARVAAGPDPATELAEARARARSPIGRGLTVRGAWRSFVAVHLVVLGFVVAAELGAWNGDHAGLKALPAWFALTAIHMSSMVDVARGLRPRWAYARSALITAIAVAMMLWLGDGWRDPGWFIGVAAAVAFRGRTRVVVLAAVFVLAGAYSDWRTLQVLPSAGFNELSWDFSYTAALTALGVIGLYGSAELIRLLGELDVAREAHVGYAVDAERRRIWGDVHDVLGQTLTAITLKADLARRMVSRSPDQSLAELDEVIGLATAQAHELGVIARGEREVDFMTEVGNAVALLKAAGIEVRTEIDIADLDEATSGLLGWAVREGTTNVLRHANARWVLIRAGRESGDLTLVVCNDGATGHVEEGTGLRGLAERAAAEHGTARGQLDDDGRFVLTVTVPERVAV